RRAHLGHRRRVERRLAVERGVARRLEEDVAVAQRHVEVLGQRQHQVAARVRAPGLDEAEVPRRNPGLDGERELAEARVGAPGPEQRSDLSGHATKITSEVIAGMRGRGYRFPIGGRKMSNVNELVVSYLAAWNERDNRKRRELVARTWSDGGAY